MCILVHVCILWRVMRYICVKQRRLQVFLQFCVPSSDWYPTVIIIGRNTIPACNGSCKIWGSRQTHWTDAGEQLREYFPHNVIGLRICGDACDWLVVLLTLPLSSSSLRIVNPLTFDAHHMIGQLKELHRFTHDPSSPLHSILLGHVLILAFVCLFYPRICARRFPDPRLQTLRGTKMTTLSQSPWAASSTTTHMRTCKTILVTRLLTTLYEHSTAAKLCSPRKFTWDPPLRVFRANTSKF